MTSLVRRQRLAQERTDVFLSGGVDGEAVLLKVDTAKPKPYGVPHQPPTH